MSSEQGKTYQEYERREYAKDLSSVHGMLTLAYREDPNQVRHGPCYQVNTSAGAPLLISTFSIISEPAIPDGMGLLYRNLLFVAQDHEGDIVGHRATGLYLGRRRVGMGFIATAHRGQGVTATIELAHFDALSREASRLREPIEYQMLDENSVVLKKLQDLAMRDKKKQGILLKKFEERKRFIHMYGKAGTLGFDRNGIRTFSPDDAHLRSDFESIADILLEREKVVENGRTLETASVVRESIEDALVLRERRISYLHEILFPQMEELTQAVS